MSEPGLPRLKRLAKSLYVPLIIAASRPLRGRHSSASYVGITGSAGKTTTKDLLVLALGAGAGVVSNTDSNNQLYGVARTLLRVRAGTRHVVQEVGAGDLGGIARMTRLLRPQIGVVLNVGTDHFSSLGGVEAVAAEKSRLVAALPADGIALLNLDDPRVAAMAAQTPARVVGFGFESGEVRGRRLDPEPGSGTRIEVSAAGESAVISSNLLGAHHGYNLLAAAATAHSLGTPLQLIAERLQSARSMLGRATLHHSAHGVRFIRDDWKAPEWSLAEAFATLAFTDASRRIVVLGTISDALRKSRVVYRDAVAKALQHADQVLVVGSHNGLAALFQRSHPGRVRVVGSVREAAQLLAGELRPGDLVLLKGSGRADHLGRIALLATPGWQVSCWRRRCGRNVFCETCGELRREAT